MNIEPVVLVRSIQIHVESDFVPRLKSTEQFEYVPGVVKGKVSHPGFYD